MYRVLASLAPACNAHFTTLLLPAAITIDPARRLLVLPVRADNLVHVMPPGDIR
jgi:hypothetical protein